MINEKEIRDIPLESIIPNRFQPRELFNEDDLKELAASIKEHGVIQPIIVRQVGDKFEIIAGERRYKASQLAGKSTIPCVVRELDDIKSSKIALLENLQRKDLTAIEEAKTYQTILKIGGMTQEELATSLGISQSAIANKIRLLTLDNDVQNALLTEQISERHARSLLNVQDVNKQKALLAKIIQNRMTVRELDDEILKMNSTDSITNQFVENNGDNSDEGGEAPYLTSVNPNNMNVDAEKIRHRAVDINPENFVDMNELLKSNKPVEQPKPVSNNMFIPENEPPKPVAEPKPKINPIDIQPTPAVEETETLDMAQPTTVIKEEIPVIPEVKPAEMLQTPYQQTVPGEAHDLRFAINNVRQAVQSTEKYGFVVDTEEFDMENIYQIVIKINKNKQ